MRFTVLGGHGFIGSHCAADVRSRGFECLTPKPDDPVVRREPLGHVIYAIGLTADFRTRPMDTIRAHVSVLVDVLEHATFDSLLYLSSTRIYSGAATAAEDAAVTVRSDDPSDLYNLSKLTGESVCHATDRPTVRIARLSNVYGPDWTSSNFLTSVIRDAVSRKHVTLSTSLDSAKDYVSVSDVASHLARIALDGRARVYNVAAGFNTTNRDIADILAATTGCVIEVAPDARRVVVPPIDVSRLAAEFGGTRRRLVDDLPSLVREYRVP